MTLTIDYHKNLNALNTVDKTYQPQLLFNDYKQGMKLSHELVQQLTLVIVLNYQLPLSACQDLQQSNKLY